MITGHINKYTYFKKWLTCFESGFVTQITRLICKYLLFQDICGFPFKIFPIQTVKWCNNIISSLHKR